MPSDYGYVEEGDSGKPHDLFLLKRLIPFLRPYRHMLICSLVLVVMLTLLELALPYFSKIALDRYIMPGQRTAVTLTEKEADDNALRYLYVTMDDPAKRSVVERYSALFESDGRRARISLSDLQHIGRDELKVLRQDDLTGLAWLVVIYLILVAADFGITFFQRMIMQRAGHRVMHDLRLHLFDHITQQSMVFFSRHPTARLVTRVTNDVQNMHELFTTFVSTVFRDIFLLTGIAIVFLVLDWGLALVVFVLLPAVFWAAAQFSMRARQVFRALRAKVGEINGRMAESMDGIQTIQSFVQEENNYQRFVDLNDENYHLGMQEIHVFALFMPIIETLALVALAVTVLYGGLQVGHGNITLGVLVVAFSYVRMFFRPIRDLAENYNVLQNALASAERIFGLLDKDKRLTPQAPVYYSDAPFQQLVFQNVSFAYTPGEPVLRNISFDVTAGQTIAVVGATGAGKTSLLNLIQRFYDPVVGHVKINGIDIRQWDEARLRATIALVTQEPVLFSTTVVRNIFPDATTVDDTTVAQIVEAANCKRLIERLPQGPDTVLAKGGAGLSSGQRQLITIARALARDAQLILLDEATSYIDSETETVIYDALENLIAGRTCVIIAHRLSTARMADRILVLKQGRIVESGSHQELMALKGSYWYLNQQNGA